MVNVPANTPGRYVNIPDKVYNQKRDYSEKVTEIFGLRYFLRR